jgi:hypothetical protein
MKCKLVKLDQLSGNEASIYSVAIEGEGGTLIDKFINENISSFKDETKNIVQRLNTIGHKTGARIQYFKVNEGNPADGVCALYDNPESHLRLYCIRFGAMLLVLGGGGPKPKNIRALQENDKLQQENYFLRWLSTQITERIKEQEIRYTNQYYDFEGDLEFEYDE